MESYPEAHAPKDPIRILFDKYRTFPTSFPGLSIPIVIFVIAISTQLINLYEGIRCVYPGPHHASCLSWQ